VTSAPPRRARPRLCARSIKCARLLPDSAARLADGKWGCYQGLFKHEVAACVDDSGGPVDCYEADSAATWVDADAQLRALIADNGCDSSEPSTWLPSHPHNTTGCTDMLPWASSTGRRGSGPAHECLDYARNGWCTLNTVVDRAKGGRLNNWPEEHCCACGGGNTVSPDVPEAEACAESQMAVHLSLAAYYNGTDLIQKLPEHFELIAEYHTRASADAFIGVGGGSCWAAFRGSEQDADWITDAVSALGTACAAANGQSIGECGLGFYVSHQSLRAAGLIDRLAALSREGRCPNGIRLTGHSLGAGLASIAAADLFTVGEDTNRTREIRLGQELTPHSLRVYTFGEPRSLRWYAADWFNSNVAKVRWLNWGDPIPASPPSSWGFKHWCAAGSASIAARCARPANACSTEPAARGPLRRPQAHSAALRRVAAPIFTQGASAGDPIRFFPEALVQARRAGPWRIGPVPAEPRDGAVHHAASGNVQPVTTPQ